MSDNGNEGLNAVEVPAEETLRAAGGPEREVRVMRRESKERLPCRLTSTEIIETSRRMADALGRKRAIEDQVAAYKKQANAELEKIEGEITHASHLVSSGEEWREVAIEIQLDYVRGVKDVTRLDTGEVIVVGQPLTNDERQLELSVGK